MKIHPILLIFTVPVSLLSACQSEEPATPVEKGTPLTFTARMEAPAGDTTRTSVQADGQSVWWSTNEEIHIFYGTKAKGKFTSDNTEPAATATFSGELSVTTPVYDGRTDVFGAIYPYNESDTFDGLNFTLTLPATQQAVKGTFGDRLFPSVAISKGMNLTFYNVCGGARFSVEREGIRSLTFQGNNQEVLAGKVGVRVSLENQIPTIASISGEEKSITVLPPEGESAFVPGEVYYIVMIPRTLQNGFTVTMDAGSEQATITRDGVIAVKRSMFGTMMAVDGLALWLPTEQGFRTNTETRDYLALCYSSVPVKALQYFFWSRGPVNWCDDAWDGDDVDVSWAGSGRLYNGDASATDHPVWTRISGYVENSYWTKYLSAIRSCTLFLQSIDDAVVDNEDDRARWKAEAHLLRAYYYAELLQWFGCGLPLYDDVYSNIYTGRASYYETVQYILRDCDAAIACEQLPWRITSSADVTIPSGRYGSNSSRRMTKALAWAIKSRMSLFAVSPLYNDGANHWAAAAEITRQAVSELEAHGYGLYNQLHFPETWGSAHAHLPNQYSQIYNEYFCNSMEWTDSPADVETIYQLTNGSTDLANVDLIGAICGYKTGTCPSQELVDAYETIDGEPVLNLAKPYNDVQHLSPNYNTANTLYDPQDPYANRDPRFYASIYYTGAKRYCTWATAAGYNSWENRGQIPGFSGTRTIATWAHWERGGIVHNEREPIMGRDFFGRTPTRTGYFQRKFAHPNSGIGNRIDGADHKDYRFAEMLLNAAEAAFESGDEASARQYMNRVRARVGMPAVGAGVTGEALRLRIRNERRVEFALEGNRYFDVRRWHNPTDDLADTDRWVTAADITCHVDADNNVTGYTYGRSVIRERKCYTNKYLKVAIPESEVNKAIWAGGGNWQNPGW